MSMTKLRSIRQFFVERDKDIDAIVDLTFQKVLAAHPEAVTMFPADLQQHKKIFSGILRKLIEMTRTCYLWPVSVQTGKASIPGLDHIRARHEAIGVTSHHFDTMKTALLQALDETYPNELSQDARAAFAFLFDVLTKSLTAAPGHCENSDLLKKFSAGADDERNVDVTLAHVMEYSGDMPEAAPQWGEPVAAAACAR